MSDHADREDYIEEIRRLNEGSDPKIKASDMDAEGKYSSQEIIQEFGSWENALEAAGINKQQVLIEELQRVADEVDRRPTSADINEYSRFSAGMYSIYFDGFRDAIEIAGLENEAVPSGSCDDGVSGENSSGDENDSDTIKSDYITELQRLQEEVPLIVKPHTMNTDGKYTANEITNAFGSWDEALREAGIDREQLFHEELHRVADLVGDKPTTTEMDEYGNISHATISNHFGSWTAALDEVFEENNEPEDGSKQKKKSESKSGPLTWEDITDGERLEEGIPLKIEEVSNSTDSNKSEELLVKDVSGNRFSLNIWMGHFISREWKVGDWYRISGVKGLVWELIGETRKQLSSTKYIEAQYLGPNPPVEGAVVAADQSDSNDTDNHETVDQFLQDMEF